MSIFEQIVNHFNAHIEASSSSIEQLTPYLAEAAHLATQTLLENHKIFCASAMLNQSIGEQFCQNLLVNPSIERPSLPAIHLNKTASQSLLKNALALQLQALTNKGDLLLLLSSSGEEAELIQALQQAVQNDLNIILLNAGPQKKLCELMPADMVKIQLPPLSNSQAMSLQFLLSQLLSELIEQQLFPGLSE